MPGVEHIDVIRGNIGDFIRGGGGGEGGEVTIVNAGNGNPRQSLLAGLSGVADALHIALTTAYGVQTADRVMGSPEGGQAGSVQIVHVVGPLNTNLNDGDTQQVYTFERFEGGMALFEGGVEVKAHRCPTSPHVFKKGDQCIVISTENGGKRAFYEESHELLTPIENMTNIVESVRKILEKTKTASHSLVVVHLAMTRQLA